MKLGRALAAAVTLAGGTAVAQDRYVLNGGSTYAAVCNPGCVCDEVFVASLHGTFTLTRVGSDVLYHNYTVSEIAWRAGEAAMSGAGTYRIARDGAPVQRLILDVNIGGHTTHFDSGDIPANSEAFPNIAAVVRSQVVEQACSFQQIELNASRICSADFDGNGDFGTDADIEAFFACLSGVCCLKCGSVDFNGDGDSSTDADIESFFSVLAGAPC